MAAMLLPFRAAIDAGARAVMTAHIRVAGLDDAPATLSRTVIGDLLRGDLRFTGVVVTDALEMRAVSATVGAAEGAVQALEAGADALCLGHDLRPEAIHEAVVDAVRSGRLAEERVQEAAARVAELGGSTLEPVSAARDVGLEAARRALVVEGDVTLRRPPLVIELAPESSIAAGRANNGLADALRAAEVVRLQGAPLDARALLADHYGRQVVVVVRDAHRHTWERVAAQALLEAGPDGVLVEVGVPLWRPHGVGYIATHGQGRVNLEAAAERLQVAGRAASSGRTE
jgi:beta-N-acetylhexosaminidase